VSSWLRAATGRLAGSYPDVQAFCLFVGPPRCGTSLVGALLDAHPDVAIAHELDVLKVATKGASRRELLDTVVENAHAAAARGRREGGYSYPVEGQWQGRVRSLRVAGGKSSRKTTLRLDRNPDGLAVLERTVRAPARLVHLARNPYDTVARLALVSGQEDPRQAMRSGVETYTALTEATAKVLERHRGQAFTLRQESLVERPAEELAALCAFLGVDADDSYLEACARLVFPSPHRTRDRVEWSPEDLAAVESLIAGQPFLRGYSRTSTG
jgi:Sulfotransferase family